MSELLICPQNSLWHLRLSFLSAHRTAYDIYVRAYLPTEQPMTSLAMSVPICHRTAYDSFGKELLICSLNSLWHLSQSAFHLPTWHNNHDIQPGLQLHSAFSQDTKLSQGTFYACAWWAKTHSQAILRRTSAPGLKDARKRVIVKGREQSKPCSLRPPRYPSISRHIQPHRAATGVQRKCCRLSSHWPQISSITKQ